MPGLINQNISKMKFLEDSIKVNNSKTLRIPDHAWFHNQSIKKKDNNQTRLLHSQLVL